MKKASSENPSIAGAFESALATLIASTKRKQRPVSLNDIARHVRTAEVELGSTAKVANLIGLSPKMVSQFLAVEALSPKVQELFRVRILDSVDLAVHLRQFTAQEQDQLAEVLVAKKMDSKDLRAVLEMRKQHSTLPLPEIVNQVLKSKTQKAYAVEVVLRGGMTIEQLESRLLSALPADSVISTTADGAIATILLTKSGYKALKDAARDNEQSLHKVVSLILQGASHV